jgi:hypothetical protein
MSFAWGATGSETGPSVAAPPMYTPPPSASAPVIPDPVVGQPLDRGSAVVVIPGVEVLRCGGVSVGLRGSAVYAIPTGLEFPRFRGHWIAGSSGLAVRISVHACAVFVGVPP